MTENPREDDLQEQLEQMRTETSALRQALERWRRQTVEASGLFESWPERFLPHRPKYWGADLESDGTELQPLIEQRLSDITRIRQRMQHDQDEIEQLKAETRSVLARLQAD